MKALAAMPLLPRFSAVCLILLMGTATPPSVAGESAAPRKGAFIGAKHTEYPDWFKESFLELKADVEEAAETDRRVILMFHQDGCPYCNALVERNLSQKDIETTLRTHFHVIAINMWGDREVVTVDGRTFTEKQFAQAMKVQFTPTLIFLDQDGRQALRLNGYLSPARFRVALNYVTQGRNKTQSFRDYAAARQGTSERTGRSLNGQPFFQTGAVDLRDLPDHQAIALFFEQRDCPMCDQLHRGPLQDAEVRRTAQQLRCFQLDMWSDQPVVLADGTPTTARDLAVKLDVKYAPTIVLLDSQGQEIVRNEAEFKRFHTNGIFEYARSGDYQAQPSFQRWLEGRAEHRREQGLDVNIWD